MFSLKTKYQFIYFLALKINYLKLKNYVENILYQDKTNDGIQIRERKFELNTLESFFEYKYKNWDFSDT